MPDDPEQRERRLATLESRGRRCDGAGRTCRHPARYTLTLKRQEDGHDVGDPIIKKVCHIPGHDQDFRHNPTVYRVIADQEMGPSKYERERAEKRQAQRKAALDLQFLPPST